MSQLAWWKPGPFFLRSLHLREPDHQASAQMEFGLKSLLAAGVEQPIETMDGFRRF